MRDHAGFLENIIDVILMTNEIRGAGEETNGNEKNIFIAAKKVSALLVLLRDNIF